MKKTTVALAIAGTFAAPAMAQVAMPGGVQLYGRLNVGIDNYEAKGAAAGSAANYESRMRVFDTASRVGIRGSEDLGSGMRAIFQIETGVNVDSGNNVGQNGVNNPNSGFWASRDSWVGIEGDSFGRLTFGRQSAYWANGTIEQIGANYINASSPLASYSQSGLVLGPVARESNAVQYSLRFSGFSATASYGHSATAVGNQSAYETAQGGVDPKDQFYALTLRYNHSVFDLQADYGTRQDIVGVPGRDSTGWKLGAAWKYRPGAQISLIYQNLESDNTFGLGVANGLAPSAALAAAGAPAAFIPAIANGCGPVASTPGVPGAVLAAVQAGLFTTGGGGTVDRCAKVKQDMWVASWEHTFGNFQALAQFGWADDVSGGNLPDSDVTTYLVGGRYFLSKRSWLYASYNQIKNGRNNFVDYWGGWVTSANTAGLAPGLPSTSSGADPRIIAVGIFHQF